MKACLSSVQKMVDSDQNTKRKRVLVTGANGFVGKPLTRTLQLRGFIPRVAVRSANSLVENVEMAVVGAIDGETDWHDALIGVDVVVHLAARVHVMRDGAVNPLNEYRLTNTAGTEHLARCAAKAGVKRFVLCQLNQSERRRN